jgi:hypothetical protein
MEESVDEPVVVVDNVGILAAELDPTQPTLHLFTLRIGIPITSTRCWL